MAKKKKTKKPASKPKKKVTKPKFKYTEAQQRESHRLAQQKYNQKKQLQKQLDRAFSTAAETLLMVKRALIVLNKETFARHRSELRIENSHDEDADLLEYFNDPNTYYHDDMRDVLLADGRRQKAKELHERLGFAGSFEDYERDYMETIGRISTDIMKSDKKYQKYKQGYEDKIKKQEEWQRNVRDKFNRRTRQNKG